MSKGVNRATLLGRLGSDPELRSMPNGTAVVNFSLATSDSWKDKQTGQIQERTEWHRVAMFGRIAEVAGQYLKKGSQVYIEGRLQTREWEKDGVKRYTTEIIVDVRGTMQMLDGKQDGQARPQNQPAQQQQQQGEYDNFDDETIPF